MTVADGQLQSVALTNADGKQVAGQLAADKRSWTSTEALGYGKTYTWSGTATGADGKPVPVSGQFSTVTPKRQVSGSLNVGDDKTYGIAMPIALTFSSKVTDKAAAEKALTVETTPKTEGSWAWLSDTQVHWRPKEYYQPGTKVTVTAKIYGVKIGDGVYGKQTIRAVRRFAVRCLAAVQLKATPMPRPHTWGHARAEWADGTIRHAWMRTGDTTAFTNAVPAYTALRILQGHGRPGAGQVSLSAHHDRCPVRGWLGDGRRRPHDRRSSHRKHRGQCRRRR